MAAVYSKVCCSDGYHFNGETCQSNVAPTTFIPPIQCPCCPHSTGIVLTYISPNGWFYNTYTNTFMQAVLPDGVTPATSFYGKCGLTQTAPVAYGEPINSIDCPCCPKNYNWNDTKRICIDPVGITTEPIPCVVCVCTPPPPFECPTCGTSGHRITFNFNFNVKHCTACVPDSFDPPKGEINSFIPNTLIDPDTSTFKLKQ